MKKIILSVIFALTIFPSLTHSKLLPPCTVILEPKVGTQGDAKGIALIYNIERKFSDKRTSLSIHALHMPKPSGFGKYDSYEVLAFIPDVISWTFLLTRYKENNWAGTLDEISPILRPTRIKVRTVNSITNEFGPVVLEGNVSCSK